MEVKIEINDEQFKGLLENSINCLPEDKIQEIVLEGIKEYISKPDVIQKLLLNDTGYGYRNWSPSQFLKDIMAKATASDSINEMRDELLSALRKNYQEIFMKAFTNCILSSLFNTDQFRAEAQIAAIGVADQYVRQHTEEYHKV